MYCIYKKGQCPSGMNEGSIRWDDEDDPNKDSNDKCCTLPDGEYSKHITTIFYCCNGGGDWRKSIDLPINEPFYLLPYMSDNCQRVKEAISVLEYITFDTEENNNFDEFKGSYGYTTEIQGIPTVYYCYYKGIVCLQKVNFCKNLLIKMIDIYIQ